MPYGELSVVKSGKESEFEFKIDNFSLSEYGYVSPHFKFEGEYWCLDLFPNENDAFIQLRLSRSSRGFPIEIEFSVSVKTTNGMKNFERRERHCFEGYGYSGYNIFKWINRSEFINRQREFINRQGDFLSSGCLTILITMQKAGQEKETQTASSACCCCKESLHGDRISFHKECLDAEIKCPRCDEVVSLQKWCDHVCQTTNIKDESAASQPSVFHPKNTILQDFKQIFNDKENCDIVLRVQDKELSAHKVILAARSPVFASMFRKNMKETVTGTVDVENIDPSCFPEFLSFLYSGEIENLSFENVRSLFIAAEKYGITDLRTVCLEFMKEKLSDEILLRKTYLESFQP